MGWADLRPSERPLCRESGRFLAPMRMMDAPLYRWLRRKPWCVPFYYMKADEWLRHFLRVIFCSSSAQNLTSQDSTYQTSIPVHLPGSSSGCLTTGGYSMDLGERAFMRLYSLRVHAHCSVTMERLKIPNSISCISCHYRRGRDRYDRLFGWREQEWGLRRTASYRDDKASSTACGGFRIRMCIPW